MPLGHTQVLDEGHHASRARPAGTPHPPARLSRWPPGTLGRRAQVPGRRIARVRILHAGASRPAPKPTASTAGGRPGRGRAGDLLAVASLVVGAGLVELFLRNLLTRPFY